MGEWMEDHNQAAKGRRALQMHGLRSSQYQVNDFVYYRLDEDPFNGSYL